MRRMTYFVMALALVLGLAQCKKEQPLEPQGEQVRITLNVDKGDNGAKVDVTGPDVIFTNGDQIIVACQGQYKGTLTHNGTNFSGEIASPHEGSYLYFYFLGNKVPKTVAGNDLVVGDYECSVDISDQSSELPVISMAPSTDPYSSSVSSYSARLHNKCSLMKFNVTTPSTTSICITGMNNLVTVNFADPEGITNGFTYDKEGEGILKMKGGSSVERWLIVLPQDALEETSEAFSEDYAYFGTRPELPAIGASQCFSGGIALEISTEGWNGNLSNLTASSSERYATATDGMTISGTLTADVKVSIADGATVTLNGANINNGSKSGSVSCAGITCVGSATINLTGGSIINSSSAGYPGIQAGPSGNTLTIQGAGSLNAQGGSNAPGIGGGNDITCGNISLLGGQISACGGDNAPGLGYGENGSCGNIHISNNVEKLNITGGSGASKSISTSGGSSLSIDNLDDVSYFDTIPFVYHPVNLSDLTEDYVAENGDVLRGELTHNVTINDPNATITLSGVNITYGGIICAQPNVRIVCFQANSLIANSNPGIQAPASGTLTIDGSGSINVQSNGNDCAGIGGNAGGNCGNIRIKGGYITSCGGSYGAGIGSSAECSCGNIEIEGGTISATGGKGAAGIGSGWGGTCGSIEIEGGTITANGGDGGAGIGSGQYGSCGNIQIQGGEVTAAGSGGGSDIGQGYDGDCGTITLPLPEGALSGLFSVSDYKQVRFSRGNLLSNGTFAANQYTYGDYFAPNYIYSGPTIEWDVLSPAEWKYLYRRSNKLGFATVNGIHGIIILPDIYTGSPITNPFRPNWISSYETCPWDDNIYSGDAWTAMENSGVVFLPAAGSYYNGSIQSQGEEGYYFSSSAYLFGFYCYAGRSGSWTRYVSHDYSSEASSRYSIRLVRTEQTD